MAVHPEVKIQHKLERTQDIIKDLERKLEEKKKELKTLEEQLRLIKE